MKEGHEMGQCVRWDPWGSIGFPFILFLVQWASISQFVDLLVPRSLFCVHFFLLYCKPGLHTWHSLFYSWSREGLVMHLSFGFFNPFSPQPSAYQWNKWFLTAYIFKFRANKNLKDTCPSETPLTSYTMLLLPPIAHFPPKMTPFPRGNKVIHTKNPLHACHDYWLLDKERNRELTQIAKRISFKAIYFPLRSNIV